MRNNPIHIPTVKKYLKIFTQTLAGLKKAVPLQRI